MTEQEMKDWIDNADYTSLLRKWRFAKSGDPFFKGEIGKYYTEVMKKRRLEVGDAAHTAASKHIGW